MYTEERNPCTSWVLVQGFLTFCGAIPATIPIVMYI